MERTLTKNILLATFLCLSISSCGIGGITDNITNEEYNSRILRRTLDICQESTVKEKGGFQISNCQEVLNNPSKYHREPDLFKFNSIQGFRFIKKNFPGEIIELEPIQSTPTLFMDMNGLLHPPNKIGQDQEVLVLYKQRFYSLKEVYEQDPHFFIGTKLDESFYKY